MLISCPKCNSPLEIEEAGIYQCPTCNHEIEIIAEEDDTPEPEVIPPKPSLPRPVASRSSAPRPVAPRPPVRGNSPFAPAPVGQNGGMADKGGQTKDK